MESLLPAGCRIMGVVKATLRDTGGGGRPLSGHPPLLDQAAPSVRLQRWRSLIRIQRLRISTRWQHRPTRLPPPARCGDLLENRRARAAIAVDTGMRTSIGFLPEDLDAIRRVAYAERRPAGHSASTPTLRGGHGTRRNMWIFFLAGRRNLKSV